MPGASDAIGWISHQFRDKAWVSVGGGIDGTLCCGVHGGCDASEPPKVSYQMSLIEPAQFTGKPSPGDLTIDVDRLEQAAKPEDAGENPRADSHDTAELAIEMTMRHTEPSGKFGNGRSRVCRELRDRGPNSL